MALEAGSARVVESLCEGRQARHVERRGGEGGGNPARALGQIGALAECDLVIEAAPENVELKREAVRRARGGLRAGGNPGDQYVVASGHRHRRRDTGPRAPRMHFFNPPAAMKLVEIVAGERSGDPALTLATAIGLAMGRTPIRAGLGRLRRQPLRPPVHAGVAADAGRGPRGPRGDDRVCRLGGGFRMGPFELMDLIGVDVNYAVARSFYEQSGGEPRWQPSPIQERMVREAAGRKAGRGFYDYGRGSTRSRPARRGRAPAAGPRGAGGGRGPAGARGPGAHRRADRERGGLCAGGEGRRTG